MIRAIDAASLPAPKFLYSPLVAAGPFVKSSGLVGISTSTGALVEGGAGAQTKCILTNMADAMADCGLVMGQLVSCNVYLVDFQNFPEVNVEWEKFLSGAQVPPARTTVGVSALPIGAQVEINFLFYAPNFSAQPDAG